MKPLSHVAIIMDGNGRWGLKNKGSRNLGHKEGLKSLENIIIETIKNNIKYLTLFVFSTENWKRPKKEINFLFNLLEKFLKNKISFLLKNEIKLKIIGKKNFNKKLNKLLLSTETITKNLQKIQINLAVNYGSKIEIIDAFKKINKKKLKVNEINIKNNIYTKNIPDPDVLIRTGNRNRLSNFLLWQLSYTEIFFVKKLWPDFNRKDYKKIIHSFYLIKRNYGSIG